MVFNLFSRPAKGRRRAPAGSRPGSTFFRPQLEAVEDRTVPAHLLSIPGNLLAITDVDLTGLDVVDPDPDVVGDEVLTATGGTVAGTLAGLPFTTDITNFALQLVPDDPETKAVECSVLDLSLAPIDIDLLGLHVDTSAICLEVTASEGEGLLGDLLCGLAGGIPDLPDLPTLDDLPGLSGALGDIIDGALTSGLRGAGDPSGADDICDGECEVLDLAVGPVNLSVLGLNVALDNCEDPAGPVQVCVSASAGDGLLGDLLCGLTGGGTIPDLGPDADLNLTQKDADKLVKRAEQLARDGDLSLKDVGKLVDQFERLTRK
jgi:hypothetical protein